MEDSRFRFEVGKMMEPIKKRCGCFLAKAGTFVQEIDDGTTVCECVNCGASWNSRFDGYNSELRLRQVVDQLYALGIRVQIALGANKGGA